MTSPMGKPAGWLPDPLDLKLLRYWDGTMWTDRVCDSVESLEYRREFVAKRDHPATPGDTSLDEAV